MANELPNTTVTSARKTTWEIRFTLRRKEWVFGMWTDQIPLENSILPEGKPRWHFFGAGIGVQIVVLLSLVLFGLLFPDRIVQVRHFVAMEIAPTAPIVRASQPRRLRRPKLVPVVHQEAPDSPLPRPEIPSPITAAPRLKPISDRTPAAPTIARQDQNPAGLNAVPIPHLREPVQLGAFAEVSGPSSAQRPNVPHLGGFNAPAGVVGGASRSGGVKEGLFSNEELSGSRHRATVTAASSRSKPVVVLYKPTPQYTDLARAKKIEGEVVLRVAFTASGEVKVLNVVKGLGYGLDESAREAALEIKFQPAKNEDGDAIDSTALVHIVFQLAY